MAQLPQVSQQPNDVPRRVTDRQQAGLGAGESAELLNTLGRVVGWDVGGKRRAKSPTEYAEGAFWRFMQYVEVDGSGCWQWVGAIRPSGYGAFQVLKGSVRAHRFIYQLLVGPIPDGLHLDHLCRNKACVNPKHLEPVTSRVNTMRGVGVTKQNALKTHCKHGHPLTQDNLSKKADPRYSSWRLCKACNRIRVARRYKQLKKESR